MEQVQEERFVFQVEWFDKQADLIRNYLLTFYPGDNSIDMYDLKNRRMFLKRMVCPAVTESQLFVGSIVTVNARQLKIAEYGDTATRKAFARGKETQFALIKPDAYINTGKIIDSIYSNGFIISKLKMSRFTNATAGRFLGGINSAENVSHLTSDVCTGMEIVAEGAVQKWNKMIGPENSLTAKV